MRCLLCGREIPSTFFDAWSGTEEAKSGRFHCPFCDAEHLRREIAPLPSGKPQFTVRLWGHLTAQRKRKGKSS